MSASAGSLPRYIVQRLLLVIPMMWILMTMVFLLMRVAPGDPISAALGSKISPQALAAARHQAGLDKPLIAQYGDYLWSVLHLNFGTTFTDNQPVIDVIRDNGGATVSLTIAAFIVALGLGIPLGLIAGRLRDTAPDVLIRLFGIISYATPIFFLGLLIQIFIAPHVGLPTGGEASAETLYIVPARTHILLIDAFLSGDTASIVDVLKHVTLPAITLGVGICGVFIRLVRVNILQTVQSDYVEAAEARGISRGKVMRHHAFRNALVPVVTVIGLQVALLLSGAVLTESTYNWPGLGYTLVRYIIGRDYGAVQGIITMFALVVVAVSVLIDIVNAIIDPRVRF
jgi:peptide/nickel transport system permease protein